MSGLRILMYHVIGASGEPGARFVLPVDEFERQMAWLSNSHFRIVPLESAVNQLLEGEAPGTDEVAITFDDGTRDQSTLAFPVLERHGFPATAFIVTAAMGGAVAWTDWPGIAGRRLMSWDEALGLEPLVRLAPHTRTHRSLPTLPDNELAGEIRGSREDVEEKTGRAATLFAYPYGHLDDRVVAAVSSAGFTAACSARIGTNDSVTPPLELCRYEVRGDRSFARFQQAFVHAG